MNSIVTPFHPKNGCILTGKKKIDSFIIFFIVMIHNISVLIWFLPCYLMNLFIYLFIYLVNFQFALV